MKVMVVEDEKEIRDILQSLLEDEGFHVIALDNGNHLISVLQTQKPDILLLDQMLPGRSGVELIKDIRGSAEFRRLPVIVVTGLAGESDKVSALDMGADDYVTKPFYPRELSARIKALVRRSTQEPAGSGSGAAATASGDTLVRDGLTIDFNAHRVTLIDREIPLTLTEFKILAELLKQSGRVLTRQNLREQALHNLNVTDRTIDVHMASLRKKLEAFGDHIETVRGVGYRFS